MIPPDFIDGYWEDVERHLASLLDLDSCPNPDAVSQEAVAKFREESIEDGYIDDVYHESAAYTAESVRRGVICESVVRALVTGHGYSETEAVAALDTIVDYLESHLEEVDLDDFFDQGAESLAEALARGDYSVQKQA